MFEVRSEPSKESKEDGIPGVWPPDYFVETRRTARKDAEQDAEILKFLGKRAWIVEA